MLLKKIIPVYFYFFTPILLGVGDLNPRDNSRPQTTPTSLSIAISPEGHPETEVPKSQEMIPSTIPDQDHNQNCTCSCCQLLVKGCDTCCISMHKLYEDHPILLTVAAGYSIQIPGAGLCLAGIITKNPPWIYAGISLLITPVAISGLKLCNTYYH